MKKLSAYFIALSIFVSCSSPEKKSQEIIESLEKQLYADSMKVADKTLARELIMAYVDFAKQFPADEKSAEYIFKSGEIANGLLRNPNEAIQHYAMVYEKYPQHEKAPVSLFLQGFVYENNLKNPGNAKPLYEEFLKKYPAHKLAGDVKFSLEHLGMSDEELIKMLEEKNKNQPAN